MKVVKGSVGIGIPTYEIRRPRRRGLLPPESPSSIQSESRPYMRAAKTRIVDSGLDGSTARARGRRGGSVMRAREGDREERTVQQH